MGVLGCWLCAFGCGSDSREDGDESTADTDGGLDDFNGDSGGTATDTADGNDDTGTDSGDDTGDGDSDSDTDTDGPPDDCENLHATIRDFRDDHPDFETYSGNDATTGLLQDMLGPDGKPVFQEGMGQITSADSFADWYHDVPGVNESVMIELVLEPQGNGRYVYDNGDFFPIDDQALGNQGRDHNFHFTTEIHTSFRYQGGEFFTFRGDDDLWIYVNDRLALDLGGLHPAVEGTIDFDDQADVLGLQVGGTYSFDVFHAERHTTESNFRIETSISCFEPPV